MSLIGWIMRLHQGRAALGSLEEMMRLGLASVSAGGLLFLVNMLAVPSFVPRSIPLVATFGAVVVMAWARATVRRIREIGPGAGQWKERNSVLVVGTGNGGRQLIRSMHGSPRRRRALAELLAVASAQYLMDPMSTDAIQAAIARVLDLSSAQWARSSAIVHHLAVSEWSREPGRQCVIGWSDSILGAGSARKPT